jgi:antitoxin (DNA-binding transcriptional repressor) of toxin-antitoxin stability system
MQVSMTEFKRNLDLYIKLFGMQDIIITKNGQQIAKIIGQKAETEATFDEKTTANLRKLERKAYINSVVEKYQQTHIPKISLKEAQARLRARAAEYAKNHNS